MKKTVTILLSMIIPPFLLGTGERLCAQSLQWFLEQGLKNNFSIHIAEKQYETADENASLGNAGMLPAVTASASYGANINSARANNRASGTTASDINYLDQATTAQLGLTWTVWNGGALQSRYRELKIMREQGDLERRMAAEDLISDITAEYYNVIQQRIRLRNYLNAVHLSRERMRIVEARYSVGNFSRLDYMQAKVDFNADSTKYMKQQEALNNSYIGLNRLINNCEDLRQTIEVADTVIAVAPRFDYDTMWEDVVAYNNDLQASRLKSRLAKESIKKAEAKKYPTIRLNAAYGYNYNRYDIAANKWTDRWGPSAGISVSFDVFDGTRRAARNAAKRNFEVESMRHKDMELSLKAQFNSICQSHENNLEVLALEEQNLETAQENYDIARERYLLGDLSGFEMREAQQSLLDAEERILKAAYDTKMCEISLLLISGGIEKYLRQ